MKKTCFIAAILITITMFMGGCGAQYRKTAIDAHKLARKTNQTVVWDMYNIAAKSALADARTKLKDDGDATKVTAELAQNFDKLRLLYMNHERANTLNGIVLTYIESRKSWIEQTFDDVKGMIQRE